MSKFGSVGPNLPHDLFVAAGAYAGPLAFDPDRDSPRAREWLESKFMPWAFPVLEGWANGEYDDLESVVFSRADDTSHRLYYYICELQRRGLVAGPRPIVLDIAKIDRPSSLARMTDQLRGLANELDVDAEALEVAIVETNCRRRQANSAARARACLVGGTPMPDNRLHEAIAQAGYFPVGETVADTWGQLGAEVEEGTEDPFAALARQLHGQPSGSRSIADPACRLRGAIAQCAAEAVVLWRIEEDEAEIWHMPSYRRLLEEAGLPHVVMLRRDWHCRDGAAEEITGFLGGLAA